MKDNLIIWGATGQAVVLEELLEDRYNICAVFDNKLHIKTPFDTVPIYYTEEGFYNWLLKKEPNCNFLVAIGGDKGKDREKISDFLLSNNLNPISAIHTTAHMASNVTLGYGVQAMMGSCIAARCEIGNNVIINTSASIDHECTISNACHIGPGAKLAGNITIGEYTFIGTGAIILPNIKIGKNCIIGAGSVVTKNLPDNILAYGNPAIIKGIINE